MTDARGSQSTSLLGSAGARLATRRLAPLRAAGSRWAASAQRVRARVGAGFGRWSFIAIVLVPTLLAGFYFAFVASDQFVAEVRLAVRVPDPQVSEDDPLKSLATLFTGAGDSAMDVFVVPSYIRSRNIVREMDANGWLRRIYSRPEADYLSRFDADESFEQLWKFWGSKVSSSVDMISGIVTVRVAAFTREDALAVAQEVTRHAERVVNDYSGRLRVDAMTNAEREIALAAERYRNALLALRDFRDTDRVVDPLKASVATVEMLLQVRIQRVAVERERAVTARLTSDQAPPTQFLAERVKALDQQIAKLQTQLTADRDSVKAANVILAKYEELELARLFASELLSVAIKAYQKARSEVERQQVYLSVFVPPAAPQLAMYPRRGVNTALVFFSALITWGILWLVVAGARDQML